MRIQLIIDSQQDNPLFGRIEVAGKIYFSGITPANKEVAAEIAQKFAKEEQLVIMKNIHTQFGQQKANFKAVVYNSAQTRKKGERITKHLRMQQEAAAKKAGEEKNTEEATVPAEKNEGH